MIAAFHTSGLASPTVLRESAPNTRAVRPLGHALGMDTTLWGASLWRITTARKMPVNQSVPVGFNRSMSRELPLSSCSLLMTPPNPAERASRSHPVNCMRFRDRRKYEI